MRHQLRFSCVLGLSVVAALAACSRRHEAAPTTWNPQKAAFYLDAREVTWMGWPGSARDHDTFCVSCHTVVPYVLSRSALRETLGESGQTQDEQKVLDDVAKRVRLWRELEPYYAGGSYDDAKPTESRGTEAVLNALILANNDARSGKMSDLTRSAFANMWTTQLTEGDAKGAWPWLRFGMEPWEANDSQYYGAALAAIAVGIAPENYRTSPEIQDKIKLLRDYLNREYATQSVLNHAALLWASARLPGLVDSARQKAMIQELNSSQRSDGGWELSSLAWPAEWNWHSIVRKRLRSDWSRQDSQSDGYATGLIVLALQEVGVPRENATVKHGLAWLASNQNPTDGSWPSISLTKRRSTTSNVGHFMRDAATAYAVLALTESDKASKHAFDVMNAHPGVPVAHGTRLDAATRGK